MDNRSTNNHKLGLCKSDEDRRERYLAAQRRYGTRIYTYEDCGVSILQAANARHNKSQKHSNTLIRVYLKNLEISTKN